MNPSHQASLRRDLGLIDVFCLASGAMISSGIFILPGLAFARTGPSVGLSYLLAGLFALTSVFSISELASAMPKSGGDYFFVMRSLGPLVGTVSGLLSWLALSLKTSFAVIGIAEIVYLSLDVPIIATALSVLVLFTVINIVGVKGAGRFEVFIVLVLLVIMAFFVGRGLPGVQTGRFRPFVTAGVNGIIKTAGFVFVSYGGLLSIATVSEEVKKPRVNIPVGLFMSLTVVMLLYTLMITVTVGVIPAGQLSGSLTPIAQAARIFAGPTGFALLSGAAILAFISTVNAGLLAASRYPYALAADELLPPRFKVLSKRYRTPGFSILVTSGIIGVSFLLNLEVLVRAASAVVLMSSLLTHVSVIVLRESRVQNYRPSFRSPLYPGIQAAGILVYAFLLADMGLLALGVSAGLIGLGVLFYLLYGRARASAEFALMHLVERVTDRSLTAHGLEAELRDIIRHRDELPFDRFDRLVEGAVVLDLQTCAGPDELFHLVSGDLSGRTGLKPDELHRLLVDREAESSTAISPFVAVPHLVLPGTGEFQLCMVRCRDGVYFSEEAPSVKAMFFLAGTRDERTFHLQALAALAQIIQNEGFEEQWMNARGESNLRDLLLLGTRRRMEQSPR